MSPRRSGKDGDERRMDLGGLTSEGSKALGPRAILVNIVPAALLTLVTVALIGSGAPDDPQLSELLKTLEGLKDGSTLVLLGVVVLVVSMIMQPLQIAVVQVLEGYWAAPPVARIRSAVARKAIGVGVEVQRRRLGSLRATLTAELTEPERARLEEELASYPELTKLMPTRLGNVLKAGEQRAGGRYGLDADVTFPHLYPFLRQPLQTAWDDYTDQLDSAAHLFVTFSLATLLSAGLLLPHGWDGWWLLAPAAFAALAWLSYRSTIAAARYQTKLLAAAFDLHRFELVAAMRMRLPKDAHEEFDVNQQLMELIQADLPTRQPTRRTRFHRGEDMVPWEGYVHPEPAAESPAAQPSEPGLDQWDWEAILGGDGERVSREGQSPTP
jgi:hypothetical protein